MEKLHKSYDNIESYTYLKQAKSNVNKILSKKEVRVDHVAFNVEKSRQNPNLKIHLRD